METFFKAIKGGNKRKVTRLLIADPGLLEKTNDRGLRPLALAAARGHLGLVKLIIRRGASADATGVTGTTALHWAASKGQEGVVTFLLRQGTQANSRDDVGRTPLMLACGKGDVGVMRVLLQYIGIHGLQEKDDEGWTALYWAACSGHEEVVSLLLEQGAHADSRTTAGHTPLLVASEQGHRGVVRVLLQHIGIHGLQETDDNGWTALHWAAYRGHEEVVSLLLEQGAHADSRTIAGKTALLVASGQGHKGVVRVLLQHMALGAAHGLQETDDEGWTALHLAAYRGHEKVVSLLLEQGAHADSRTIAGHTPLMLACEEGHLGVVRVLLEHRGGQGLHQTDHKRRTALHLAALWGREEVAAFLLRQGADTNSRDTFGRTPLLCGCKRGRLDVVRVLARHMGEDGLKERYAGARTVLHYASIGGHEEVAALLIGMGAQANSRDALDKTPLMWACEKCHMGVVRMLAQHMGEEGLKEKDANGRTILHWAVEKGYHEAVKILLLAGADPTITDNEGRTPRALAEGEVERAGCVAAFEWYECELERRAIIFRSSCLHKAYTTRRVMPTSPVPTYLQTRVAAGYAVPKVVVSPQPEPRATRDTTYQAASSGKRKAADEGGDLVGTGAGSPGVSEVGEEERHAVLEYVVQALNEALVIELLEGFPL